jgi:hypothetical protein
MLKKVGLLTAAAMLFSAMNVFAQSNSLERATVTAAKLKQLATRIDQIIAQTGVTPGSPSNPNDPWWTEADSIALPIFTQASGSLWAAATNADQWKLAVLQFNFALANFKFAMTCNMIAQSRSQLARANSAAMLPPVGFLAAFGPEITAHLQELQALRTDNGCP